jgi:hypothetical protein
MAMDPECACCAGLAERARIEHEINLATKELLAGVLILLDQSPTAAELAVIRRVIAKIVGGPSLRPEVSVH